MGILKKVGLILFIMVAVVVGAIVYWLGDEAPVSDYAPHHSKKRLLTVSFPTRLGISHPHNYHFEHTHHHIHPYSLVL